MDGKILIMDCTEFERNKLKALLAVVGSFEFVELSDGSLYYKQTDTLNTFDLIIMDIAFPYEENGFEILEDLRKNNRTNAPVIIITKSDKLEYRNRASKYCVIDFIKKPYTASRLQKSVQSVIKLDKKFKYDVTGAGSITMSFDEYFSNLLKLSSRTNQPVSILLITQNGLTVDDNASHNTEPIPLIKNLNSIVTLSAPELLRSTDNVVVNGNGDMLFILPCTDSAGVMVVCAKLKELMFSSLEQADVNFDDIFHAEYASYPEDGNDFQSLMESVFKKISNKITLEKITSIPLNTRKYANRRYNQFNRWF